VAAEQEVRAQPKQPSQRQLGGYANAFPDLLTFHDAATVVEQKLFVMFLEHRSREAGSEGKGASVSSRVGSLKDSKLDLGGVTLEKTRGKWNACQPRR